MGFGAYCRAGCPPNSGVICPPIWGMLLFCVACAKEPCPLPRRPPRPRPPLRPPRPPPCSQYPRPCVNFLVVGTGICCGGCTANAAICIISAFWLLCSWFNTAATFGDIVVPPIVLPTGGTVVVANVCCVLVVVVSSSPCVVLKLA